MIIHKQLVRPPRSYVVYSDLHGSYEKFIYWLKNGFGYFKIAVNECLGKKYDQHTLHSFEVLLLLINRGQVDRMVSFIEGPEDGKRPPQFFYGTVSKDFVTELKALEEKGLSKKVILVDLVALLRNITRGDERRIIKFIPTEFLENILKLYQGEDEDCYQALLEGMSNDESVFQIMVSLLVKIIIQNMFDKQINLGDTFDRGEGADKLLALYRLYFDENFGLAPLHYILGNHDVLWMGAAIGNPAMAMTALRISMRYNNVNFLARYGFDLTSLKNFANKSYKLTPRGNYAKGKDIDSLEFIDSIKMTKVLFVLESKLTLQLLKEELDFLKENKQADLWEFEKEYKRYHDLLNLFPTGIKEDEKVWDEFQRQNPLFLDCYFPTIEKSNPALLTKEEEEIVNDLMNQFTRLTKLKTDMNWFFLRGEVYRVVDQTLYFHAAIPSTVQKGLAESGGLSGKPLLDEVTQRIFRIGQKYREHSDISIHDKMFFWHLWCGSESVFFCKSKMATIERTMYQKDVASEKALTTHQEIPDPFYKNIRDDHFLTTVLSEFKALKVCMGHTPVKTLQQTVLSSNVGAFVIDGGASDAYGDRGAVLIHTPEYNYLTMHPELSELEAAQKAGRLSEVSIFPLEETKNLKLKDVDKGMYLKEELKAIDELLSEKLPEFKKHYFEE